MTDPTMPTTADPERTRWYIFRFDGEPAMLVRDDSGVDPELWVLDGLRRVADAAQLIPRQASPHNKAIAGMQVHIVGPVYVSMTRLMNHPVPIEAVGEDHPAVQTLLQERSKVVRPSAADVAAVEKGRLEVVR